MKNQAKLIRSVGIEEIKVNGQSVCSEDLSSSELNKVLETISIKAKEEPTDSMGGELFFSMEIKDQILDIVGWYIFEVK